MTAGEGSLLPFYAGWGVYNERLIAAIAPLTDEQLALRTTPEHWPIGTYATHIIRAWWFHARMGEGSDDLTPLELWGLSLAMFKIANGEVRQSAIGGTNIGRDSDTIAGRAAMLSGTLRGSANVPAEWVRMFSESINARLPTATLRPITLA